MVQHSAIDHTGLTGVGGGDAADVTFDPTGLGNTAATDVQAAMEDFDAAITAAGGGSVVTIPQAIVYPPTSFPADSVDNSSATPWADVGGNAFATRAIEGNKALHLRASGASQACVARRTLGTTRAGDFDYRMALMPLFTRWSSANDTFLEWVITQSGGTAIAAIKLSVLDVVNNISQGYLISVNVPGSYTAQRGDILPAGDAGVFQIKRVSGVITFWYGIGSQPLALRPIIQTSDNAPYARSDSNTAARLELRLTTPSGPSSTAFQDAYAGPLHDAS